MRQLAFLLLASLLATCAVATAAASDAPASAPGGVEAGATGPRDCIVIDPPDVAIECIPVVGEIHVD